MSFRVVTINVLDLAQFEFLSCHNLSFELSRFEFLSFSQFKFGLFLVKKVFLMENKVVGEILLKIVLFCEKSFWVKKVV